MGGSAAIVSRSVYTDRLRRAFILRCHPDRFRRYDEKIRKQQSVLLQALSERMIEADFKDYTSNISRIENPRTRHNNQQNVVQYAMEKRDGSLLHRTLDLNASVENILKNLASALELSGAAKLPPPPAPLPLSSRTKHSNDNDQIHWTKYDPHDSIKGESKGGSTIDHRYDVNSNRGRDLERFLSSVTPSQIEERKAYRMDATAAALVARRLFSFQSIDGIRLGWSSKSFAGLLSSLIRLHEEYQHRFNVQSFYPLGLVFTNNEKKPALDVYGGNIYLTPSGTQLEWLESIREVTEERLDEFLAYRRIMTERVALLQEGLVGDRRNIANGKHDNTTKVKKGFTCPSFEYYMFLQRATEPYRNMQSISMEIPIAERNGFVPAISQSSLSTTGHLRLVVESPESCRRPKVTREGFIQVPSTITSEDLTLSVSKLSGLAKERWDVEQEKKHKCREAIEQVQWKFGLQKVSRSNERVRWEDFLSALSRLIDHETQLEEGELAGSNLQISTNGHCHLSDDGSLVIPHNWTISAL
ncbi:unnamed protein product [Pseudo-nitzschia multistriata]|uniref:DUF4461 domain-containing protein n=1 Tax=Pseudo-nitzschia multistriata TaxID=183589 RepID=A0A448YUS6_9STRA|nr:unnamed protein product [Pseudo-nitzschia multistriata]